MVNVIPKTVLYRPYITRENLSRFTHRGELVADMAIQLGVAVDRKIVAYLIKQLDLLDVIPDTKTWEINRSDRLVDECVKAGIKTIAGIRDRTGLNERTITDVLVKQHGWTIGQNARNKQYRRAENYQLKQDQARA